MFPGLGKKFVVGATILSGAAAAFWMAPAAVLTLTAPQQAVAEESPRAATSDKCESATWPNIPQECLTRADAEVGSVQVAGAD